MSTFVRMIRSCLLAYIAITLFVGQINLPFFTHVCHGMGKTWTAIIKPPKACCGKRKQDLKEHHSQPVEPKSCDSIDKGRCCEDHINYASLSVQVIQQQVQGHSHVNWFSDVTPYLDKAFFQSVPPVFDAIVHVHGPPQNLYGRSLLISQQIFRC